MIICTASAQSPDQFDIYCLIKCRPQQSHSLQDLHGQINHLYLYHLSQPYHQLPRNAGTALAVPALPGEIMVVVLLVVG